MAGRSQNSTSTPASGSLERNATDLAVNLGDDKLSPMQSAGCQCLVQFRPLAALDLRKLCNQLPFAFTV
jgi:hypothetical protein